MAQYKKDLVKEKIDSAALKVFASKGYQGTKIADISDYAEISVGNIYKYYKSKEELFHGILPESFIESVKNILFNKILSSKSKELEISDNSQAFWLSSQAVIEFLVENRNRVLIALKGSRGTKYENTREELVDFLIAAIRETDMGESREKNDVAFTLRLIYSSLIDITLKVLEAKDSLEEVKEGLSEIDTYHLFGITGLLK